MDGTQLITEVGKVKCLPENPEGKFICPRRTEEVGLGTQELLYWLRVCVSQQNFPLASHAPSPFHSTHGCIIWERVTEFKILDVSKQSIRGRSRFSISPCPGHDNYKYGRRGVLCLHDLLNAAEKEKTAAIVFYRVNCNRFSVLNHFHSPKLRYSSAVPKF